MYLNVAEVESALIALAGAYPSTCELITLPNSTHEGRTSHCVRLGLGSLDSRPAIALVGGQHAREWGSCDICINFLADMLEAYQNGTGLAYGGQSYNTATIKHIVEDAQVFVFPCVNPDGRNHSQNFVSLWRKNRNPTTPVDVNRNYDFLWDFDTALHPSSGAAVSNNPSSDFYHGPSPHSEPENKNVVWLLDTHPQIRWLIDIHSYSELLYHVWGDDQNQVTNPSQNFTNSAFDGLRGLSNDSYGEYITSDDLGTHCGLVEKMQQALAAVRGINYKTGQTFSLYPTTGTLSNYPYSRHIADPTKTKTYGFLIEWGTEFQPPWIEMENIILDVTSALIAFADEALKECAVLDIAIETPTLQFLSVPEGETTYRAVTFSVTACCSVEFYIVHGPEVLTGPSGTAFGTPLGTWDTAPATPGGVSNARLWISYSGTADGDSATGTVTVRCKQTNQEWTIDVSADVVARPTAAAMLVFDKSGSMLSPSGLGPGITRGDVLSFSAAPFADVIEDIHGLGILQFDHDPHDTMPVTPMNLTGRLLANGHIESYVPNASGWTSIGEAVDRARNLLNMASGLDYHVKAMIVLTDGRENHNGFTRRYISEVAGSIDSRVYAIGLGTPENLQPAALHDLCAGNDGYMMVTGNLDTSAIFRLTKYYQQILAGVTNNEIVVDPEGSLKPGTKVSIPIRLSEADISGDVILLSTAPDVFRFSVQTPSGQIIDPSVAASNPGIAIGGGSRVLLYRMNLPVLLSAVASHGGEWSAVLEVDERLFKRHLATLEDREAKLVATHGVRYSLMARAYSNLRMKAELTQKSREPGAELGLHIALSEYSVPVKDRATVTGEVQTPAGNHQRIVLKETEPGIFETSMIAKLPGVYHIRILARGKTFKGTKFTREQLLTGSTWQRGDQPFRPSVGSDLGGLLSKFLSNSDVKNSLEGSAINSRDTDSRKTQDEHDTSS